MSYQNAVEDNPRAALFDVMDGARTGMLGLNASKAGLKPMTHFPDAEAGAIWFISANDTDLVRELGAGRHADYVVISKNHDVHASIRGTLAVVRDEAKLDELWSPVVGAWFKEGREDPRATLLRFTPEIAEIWASTTSSLKFGFEVMRANVSEDHQPDLGSHGVVNF